ncbi:2-methylaconitate cis-trans isomerase PrpF [Vibrio sp. SM6]|uniref:2-methylaconitate cis-trans isomerase PrpF n=1 Tax=Vibrio agarilyticus TaxID=2726741 RepID=A0A7X8YGJ4_9VIBR|nr:2-methylaconitate cis-trans isomerase PrpF [Vibrio agarilyticus]NLS12610.1 2-methylaconitate cis-trans isomerase PrpF [Vibrio agarilyticus]
MSNLNHGRVKVAATYMRGGTSKGVFFKQTDLPIEAQRSGAARDEFFQRVIGSPDPYGKQIDGMGGGTSSTSKVVIVAKSTRPDHDVDYLFGQVSIGSPHVDWSGNCGNLTAAVGPFAIHSGLIDSSRLVENGVVAVRIWQANIEQTLVVEVPMKQGEVDETGDFMLDGVAFPAAELAVDFIAPAGKPGEVFPTGNLIDALEIPEMGTICATLINAGIPTVFVDAAEVGFHGVEGQSDINHDANALARLEQIRRYGALKMGLIEALDEGGQRLHTPKVAFVSPPQIYQTSSGKTVDKDEVDILVRAVSMGQLHHAMMGTAAVAIAVAASIPGTLVNLVAGGSERETITFGHPSGTLKVGAKSCVKEGLWWVEKASMRRSARVLMSGSVYVPRSSMHVEREKANV